MYKRQKFVILAATVVTGLAVLTAAIATSSFAESGGEPPEKQTLRELLQARQAAAEQGPRAPKDPVPLVTSCPIDVNALKNKVGITPFPEGKMPFQGMNPINSALVLSNSGVPYAVYAGSKAGAPQQGVLLVWEQQVDPCASALGLRPRPQPQGYKTPFHEGAVRITRIDRDNVAFASSSGRAGQLNYVTGQFQ